MSLRFLFSIIGTFFCIIQIGSLQGHGFAVSTLVKTAKGSQSIETIKSCKKIIAYNTKKKRNVKGSVRATGFSISNCYIRIRFNMFSSVEYEEILCTPTQEFYRITDDTWVSAAQLTIGDTLKCDGDKSLAVSHLEFINEPLKVCILEVKKYHNFFVGKYDILTHNTALPWSVAIGISIPLGEAAAGGAAGSFFGPIGVVGGVFVGSILGCGLQYLANQDKTYQYDMSFDVEKVIALMKGGLNQSSQKNAPSGCGPSSPQDPKKNNDKKRITNDIPKSEFFKKVSDRYERWRGATYRAKRNAEKLGNGKVEYLEWDHLHNDVEAYNEARQHIGSINPKTTEIYKNPVAGRKIPR